MTDAAFEAYVFDCVRRRPADLQWHEQLMGAAVGLVGQATRLIRAAQSCGDRSGREEQMRLQEIARQIEFYRALLYYQLDVRPAPVAPRSLDADASPLAQLARAAKQVAIRAGILSSTANDLLNCPSDISDANIQSALTAFEQARAEFLERIGVSPERLWIDAASVPQSGSRLH